jgi:hypothetical protein
LITKDGVEYRMEFFQNLKNILDGESLPELRNLKESYVSVRPKNKETKEIIKEITKRIDILEPNTLGAKMRRLPMLLRRNTK